MKLQKLITGVLIAGTSASIFASTPNAAATTGALTQTESSVSSQASWIKWEGPFEESGYLGYSLDCRRTQNNFARYYEILQTCFEYEGEFWFRYGPK